MGVGITHGSSNLSSNSGLASQKEEPGASLSGPRWRLWVWVERSTGLRSPRPRTRQRSRRLDLPGKAPEQRRKVLQMQGKPPPATSPTSVGNGGTSLHTMTGTRGGGGEGGKARGAWGGRKKAKKTMRLSRHPPPPQPQHLGAVQGPGWSRSEAAAAPGGTRHMHTHTRAHTD